jgi:hypothetical protein
MHWLKRMTGDLPQKRIRLTIKNSSNPDWNEKVGDFVSLLPNDIVKITCSASETLSVPLANMESVRPSKVSQMVIVIADGDHFGKSLRVREVKDDVFTLVWPTGRDRMSEKFLFRTVELVLSLQGRKK